MNVPFERDYSEGDDELCLVACTESPKDKVPEFPVIQWSEKDDNLLTTLYSDRGCSIAIIATVFKVSESDIEQRLSNIGLLKEGE